MSVVRKFLVATHHPYADLLHPAGMFVAANPLMKLGMLNFRLFQRELNAYYLLDHITTVCIKLW